MELAAISEFDAEKWDTMIAECDDAANVGDTTDWRAIVSRAMAS